MRKSRYLTLATMLLVSLTSCATSSGTGGVVGGTDESTSIEVNVSSSSADQGQIELFELQNAMEERLLEEDYIQDASVFIAPPDEQVSEYSVSVMLEAENMTEEHQVREIVQGMLPEATAENISVVDHEGNIW